MEEVTKVIFDVWNRSQIVFGSVELVTSINVISGNDHNFFWSTVEMITIFFPKWWTWSHITLVRVELVTPIFYDSGIGHT